MQCSRCGKLNPNDVRFCAYCGAAAPGQSVTLTRAQFFLGGVGIVAAFVCLGGFAVAAAAGHWFQPLTPAVASIPGNVQGTPIPSPTLLPTFTIVPPAKTASPTEPVLPRTVAPTATFPPAYTPTDTPLPPTSTFTPVPPTDTFTPRPPTDTFTPRPLPPTFTPVPVSQSLFVEDFSSADLGRAWVVEHTGNLIGVTNGVLQLGSTADNYPYLHVRSNPFPPNGAFRYQARLRYAQVNTCGVGIMLTSYVIPGGQSEAATSGFQQASEQTGVAAGIWQDAQGGMQLWYRAGPERGDIRISGPDTNWHELSIAYVNSIYSMYLDGGKFYESKPTAQRPLNIWLGHPALLSGPCQWSSLQVDYITVATLP